MSQRNIPCTIDPSTLVLSPNGSGPMNAVIDIQETQIGGVTGVLSFGGVPQAFLTIDDTGRRVISYTLTNQNPSNAASVENIINAF